MVLFSKLEVSSRWLKSSNITIDLKQIFGANWPWKIWNKGNFGNLKILLEHYGAEESLTRARRWLSCSCWSSRRTSPSTLSVGQTYRGRRSPALDTRCILMFLGTRLLAEMRKINYFWKLFFSLVWLYSEGKLILSKLKIAGQPSSVCVETK